MIMIDDTLSQGSAIGKLPGDITSLPGGAV